MKANGHQARVVWALARYDSAAMLRRLQGSVDSRSKSQIISILIIALWDIPLNKKNISFSFYQFLL